VEDESIGVGESGGGDGGGNNIYRGSVEPVLVKNERSGLNIFLFSSLIFIFFSVYFPYSIFRTRVRVRVTRSCCHTAGHIR